MFTAMETNKSVGTSKTWWKHSFRLQYEQSFAKLVPQQIFTYECPSYNALGTEMVLNNAHYRRCLLVLFSKTVVLDTQASVFANDLYHAANVSRDDSFTGDIYENIVPQLLLPFSS